MPSSDTAALMLPVVLRRVRLTVRVSASSHGEDLPGVAGWNAVISACPVDAEFEVPIGTMTLQAVDLRAGRDLMVSCDQYTAELGEIAAILIDPGSGRCLGVDSDGPAAGTLIVVEDVLLPAAWRGAGIGPAAARIAASLIANDLLLIALIPGDVDTVECPRTGLAVHAQNREGTESTESCRSFDKVLFAFTTSGFDELPDSDGLLVSYAGSPRFAGALEAAHWSLERIPLTAERTAWFDDYSQSPAIGLNFE